MPGKNGKNICIKLYQLVVLSGDYKPVPAYKLVFMQAGCFTKQDKAIIRKQWTANTRTKW